MTSFFGNHLRVRYTFMVSQSLSLSNPSLPNMGVEGGGADPACLQITHTLLLLFNLLFCVLTTYDAIMFIFHCCSIGFVFIYLIPAAVLCWRNRESGYERGWVEMLYITYQVLFSWGTSLFHSSALWYAPSY